MPELAQGPGRAAQSAGTAAENAQLDARLEVAAKKAALRSLEAQADGRAVEGAPTPPARSRGPRNTIVIERDGQKTVLENPTAEQLAQAGLGTSTPAVTGSQVVAMTASVMFAVVAALYLVLAHRRRMAGVTSSRAPREMDDRMARIENAIESVAVEVERISESQRFTSRVLSEGAAMPIVGVAQAERVIRNNGEG
jgi:hypothetical protein